MATLAEIRAQHPEYNDMSDADLARGIHQKFYADMPYGEFQRRMGIGESSEIERDVRGFASTLASGETGGLADEATGLSLAAPIAAARFFSPNDRDFNPVNRARAAIETARPVYEGVANVERSNREDFYQRRPMAATATEIGGSLAVPAGRVSGALRGLGMRGAVNVVTTGGLLGLENAMATGTNAQERFDPLRMGYGFMTGAGTAGALYPIGRAIGSVGELGANILSRFSLTPEQRATRLLARGMADAQLTPQQLGTRAAALRRQGGNTEETIAEVGGRPLQRMARGVANVRGPGQQIANDVLESRSQGVTPRVMREATRALGPEQTRAPNNFADAQHQLAATRRAQAEVGYQEAYKQEIAPQHQTELLASMTRPGHGERAIATALDEAGADVFALENRVRAARAGNANNLADIEAELASARQAHEALQKISSGLGSAADVSPRVVDLYQRGLSGLVDDAGPLTSRGRAFGNAQRSFNEYADQAAPRLGDVRTQYGRSKRIGQFMEQGRQALTMSDGELSMALSGHLPEEAAQGLPPRPLTTEERDGFMLGILDAIDQKVRTNDTATVLRFARNQVWQDHLKQALGANGARRLLNRIAREAGMQRFRNAVEGGSQTTPMAEDIRALTEGEAELGFLNDFVDSGGNVRNAVTRLGARMYDRFKQAGIRNPRVNEALARRLYSPVTDGNIRALQNDIANLPAYATARLGQPTAEALGRTGAAWGAIAGSNPYSTGSDELTAMSGAPQLAAAGDAFGRGDYADAAYNGAVGTAMLAPQLMGVPRPVQIGALAAGAGLLGARAASARQSGARIAAGAEHPITEPGVLEGNAAAIAMNLAARKFIPVPLNRPLVREGIAAAAGALGGGFGSEIGGGDFVNGVGYSMPWNAAIAGGLAGRRIYGAPTAVAPPRVRIRDMGAPEAPPPVDPQVRAARGAQVRDMMRRGEQELPTQLPRWPEPAPPARPQIAPPQPSPPQIEPPQPNRGRTVRSRTPAPIVRYSEATPAQQKRLLGGDQYTPIRVAESHLGMRFRTNDEALQALNERIARDPEFAARMNRLYSGTVRGGGR
jgi:hypothetical protein